MKSEAQLRQEMCHVGCQLYSRNYIIATDGNLSVRLPGNVLLGTPSGICKGSMTPEQLLKTDLQGRKISGFGKPSSELLLHIVAYRERPDIRAVVHAHPLVAVAMTVAGKSLTEILIPEVAIHVGRIATAPYATPGTQKLADSILPFIADHDAIMLERHGIVAMGQTLTEAYHKVECVEYAAQVAWLAGRVGPVTPLDHQEIQILQRARYGRPLPKQNMA